MPQDEFQIPAHVKRAVRAEGYTVSDAMAASITMWFGWYTGSDGFYEIEYVTRNGAKRKRDRMTLHPARRVCREYASLILNEDTVISVDAPKANEWLRGYLDTRNFWPTGQMIVEKGFALGTAAWALWFDVSDGGTDIKLRRYDARMILPLSWDEEGVTECAFVTRVHVKGKPADQLQMHVLDSETETYHIRTKIYIDGEEADPERLGVLEDFDTEQRRKTFGIFKPALENTVADLSPYGVSVFGDAVSAIKAVDMAFDAMCQEVDLTQVLVFMDESMIDVRSENGRAVPVTDTDDRRFRKVNGNGVSNYVEVFSPDIRIDPLRKAFDVALAELGDLCGFGQQYFMLDRAGGLKTATEVVSDNSALMRNIRKHENVMRGALQDVISALLECARIHCGADIEEDFGAVSVAFDDSVISDTQTEKNTMLAEIAAGVLPKWKYAERFYGMSEEEAKAALPQEIIDRGY